MSNNKLNNNIIENITGVGDNNKNKTNLIKTNNINKFYSFKQIINNEEKKIKRPGLEYEGEGTIIPFEAMIGGPYYRLDKNCITIINLHKGDEYLADHTQLVLNESYGKLSLRNKTKSKLISAVGEIITYNKNNKINYAIKLLPNQKVIIKPDEFYNSKYIDIKKINGNDILEKSYDKLIIYKHDDLLHILNSIRYKINLMTKGFLCSDFIYHYIINQYSLNTLNLDMYRNTIQSNEFNDEDLYYLLIILGNVIYNLTTHNVLNLQFIMQQIVMDLNCIQGIRCLTCIKKESIEKNKKFKKLCEKRNISFGVGWQIVRNRNLNFKIQNYHNESDVIEKGLIGIYYIDI